MPKITTRNAKLGTNIGTINLPAGITCRKDAPCAKTCYAKHGRFLFSTVRNCYDRNLQEYRDNPEMYFQSINTQLYFTPFRFIRWHSSGDIPDYEYLLGMVDTAIRNPNTKFLAFTKQYEIVNRYLESNSLPENLNIVFSNWGDWQCENPYDLPTSWVRFKNEPTAIPENAMQCSGYCGDCVMGDSCWTLRKNESVVFDQH